MTTQAPTRTPAQERAQRLVDFLERRQRDNLPASDFQRILARNAVESIADGDPAESLAWSSLADRLPYL